ncbi:quinate 5-dehydrogenase [Azotosporobacter soli]|uniref:quinate 5-dehydrogenase n=1 Tax=Azotosporobacter soli TaxID=3055040 RepID=UPI0031FF3DDD
MEKHVVSISLGSSSRNHVAVSEFAGQKVRLERIGTDGDKAAAKALLRRLDGQVDAFGLGGTDLFIYAGNRRYTFRESAEIAAVAKETPIVDGSGLKNTLERRVIRQLAKDGIVQFKGKRALMVCAVDRFGMAEALEEVGCINSYGDLMFGLGLPLPLHSLKALDRLARILAPVVTRLPVSLFYPTGETQQERRPKFAAAFNAADIIAGDLHFIRRYMPDRLPGKIVITNTVTDKDKELLRQSGASLLITTTPELDGRSFGTNVMEAVLVAMAGKKAAELTAQDYEALLDRLAVKPRIECWT